VRVLVLDRNPPRIRVANRYLELSHGLLVH
jgi:hypothetical protein